MTFLCLGLTALSFLLILFSLRFFRTSVPCSFILSFLIPLRLCIYSNIPFHWQMNSPPHTYFYILFCSCYPVTLHHFSFDGWTSPKGNLHYVLYIIHPELTYKYYNKKTVHEFLWHLIWCVISWSLSSSFYLT